MMNGWILIEQINKLKKELSMNNEMKTKINKRLLMYCLIGISIGSLVSCSKESLCDEGSCLSAGPGQITFTLGGIAQGGHESLTRAATEPETITQNLGDGLSLVYTLSADPLPTTRTTTMSVSPMEKDVRYRVILYKMDGSYVTEKEFTAGGTDNSIEKLQNIPYQIVAISYNSKSKAPGRVGNATTVDVDPTNDLLHWVGSVDLSSGSTTANILFHHRFTKLTVKADVHLTGDNITSVASATVEPAYKGVLTLLANNKPSKGGAAAAQTFSFGAVNAPTVTGDTRYVFTNEESPVTVTFSNLTVKAAHSYDRTINPSVVFSTVLQSGYSYTLTANLEASKGDYYPFDGKTGSQYQAVIPLNAPYNGQNSLTFLTYNLGADPDLSPKEQMAYPHTDNKNIRVYGGCYQWGRRDVQHSLRDSIAEAPNSFTMTLYNSTAYNYRSDFLYVLDSGTATGDWVSDHYDASNMWGNGGGPAYQTDFSYNSGTPYTSANQNNPCPAGFRVPTQHEWSLIVHNDGDPRTVDDQFSVVANTSVYDHNQTFVWVRVSDGKLTSSAWKQGKMNGWALYETSEWNKAAQDYKIGTKSLTENAAPNPLMFLPAAGYRLNGSFPWINDVGFGGYYWSSTVVDITTLNRDQSYALYFNNDISYNDGHVSTVIDTRGIGESVRCVKIQ